MTDHLQHRAKRYLSVILRWILIAAFVFVATMYAGVQITDYVLPKTYQATAKMQVRPHSAPGPLDSAEGAPLPVEAEFEFIEAPEILQPVITDLELDKTWAERVFKDKDGEPSPDEALAYLRQNLTVEHVHGTDIIEITSTSDQPEEAAAIANAVADRYKSARDAEEAKLTERNLQALRDQIAQQEKVIADKKAGIEKMPITLPGHGAYVEQHNELQEAQRDVEARSAFLDKTASLPDDAFQDTLGSIRPDPDLAKLREDITAAQARVDDLLKSGGSPSDPRLVGLQKDLSAKTTQLHAVITMMRQHMKTDLDLAKARVVLVRKEMDEFAKHDPAGVKAFEEAQRELDQQQTLLAALNLQLNQISADTSVQQSPVRIVTRAVAPAEPIRPNRRLCHAITAAVASLLGVMIASCVEIILLISRAARDAGGELVPAPR